MTTSDHADSHNEAVTASQDHRIVIWIESVALFLLVAYLFAHTMPRAWKRLNTDFPNYYMSARLAHEGFDTSREYEWIWLQRQKDHRSVDDNVIGLVPITPFSTLVMWPLTGLSPVITVILSLIIYAVMPGMILLIGLIDYYFLLYGFCARKIKVRDFFY